RATFGAGAMRLRLASLAAALAAVLVLTLSTAGALAAGPLRLNTVKLAGAEDKTEPRIAVGPDDRRWVVTNAPGGTATVYSSRDGGATWQRTPADPQQRGATIDTDILTMHP